MSAAPEGEWIDTDLGLEFIRYPTSQFRPWKLSDGRQRGSEMSEHLGYMATCVHGMAFTMECEPCGRTIDRPIPLESMIEEMKRGGASVELESNEHLTSVRRCDGGETMYESDPDLRTAIESLHAAWRERRNDEDR